MKLTKQVVLIVSIALTLTAMIAGQGRGGGQPGAQAPAPNLSFDRLLKSNQEPQNWLTYSGSYMSQRHSLLSQITPANVRDLELKWVYQVKSLEKHEVTPIVVDGTMYTVQFNDVIALNAKTGKALWTFNYKPDAAARNCCGNLTRGLAVLDNKVFLASYDAHMIAIDATTGRRLWDTPSGADPKQGYSFTHAPLVIKDKVIAGSAGGEFGVRGFIAAWDVNTGKEVWRFNTVPGPGEPGSETWSGDSWQHGGAPIWVTGSYDPAANLTYWGTGNPGPDWDGRARLGDNLYSCAVIALDPDTGKLKWHYQFYPHNEFDWDSTQVPVLVDADWQGQQRKLMLWANRNGYYYVLDRLTGEFLKGQAFVKANWLKEFDAKGRPIPALSPTREGTLVYPGNQGGTNWYNPSYSPRTGLFYIPVWENSSSTYVHGTAPPEFHEGDRTFAATAPRGGPRGEETYSAVRAIDPKTGEKKWDYRMASPTTNAGVLTTATDVLFSGGQDGSFYALDARDGKKLWETNLGSAVAAGPMTYQVDGKQYVSIMVGSSLFTFGLR